MTGCDPMIRDWLLAMYNEEITAEEGTIENEEAWAVGSEDAETEQMHRLNANHHRQYLAVLRNRRDKVAEGDF